MAFGLLAVRITRPKKWPRCKYICHTQTRALVFFEQDDDTLSEPDDAVGLISLPDALAEADQMIETGDADFHDKAETVLGVLYATDTLPIRRSALHKSNHKTLAAIIVLMMDQCCQVEVNEYNTAELKASGYSKSFMQYMEKAAARSVLEVVGSTPHTAIYYVSDSLTGVFADDDH
jgi:hypothetical protein